MFKLYIFNPEHDMALGKNSDYFTIPKAAIVTRKNYDHIPAFWADNGDWVLVENEKDAQERLRRENREYATVKFVTEEMLERLSEINLPSAIIPWGWDKNIVKYLLKVNPCFIKLVPDEETLNYIRHFSSREFVANGICRELVGLDKRLIGDMNIFSGSIDELTCIVNSKKNVVLKSPWSSSGRGVHIVNNSISDSIKGWVKNTLKEQNSIIIEPYYDKILDFAMEFVSDKEYGVKYLGLSIFNTVNGRYSGSIIDNEENKRSFIERYLSIKLLDIVRDKLQQITTIFFNGKYSGPFGVDMMIVNTLNGYLLHPCVELNLRFTMGHASLQNYKY